MNITEIYEQLRAVGVVKSKYDFSQHWLGRCQSYTTAIEASGREASADALATLHTRLGALVAHLENAQGGASWDALSAQRATLRSVHGRLRELLVEHWYRKASGTQPPSRAKDRGEMQLEVQASLSHIASNRCGQ